MPKKKPTAKQPTAKKSIAKKPPARPPKGDSPRAGGSRFTVFNSGLEVWLYDEGSIAELKGSGGMDFQNPSPQRTFEELTAAGLTVAYSLYQDDAVDIELFVGPPLTEKELSTGRWLDPQTALLKLPTGSLAIESSDARRAGPEEPTEKGAVFTCPPGDYRLTLYRVDHEALDREGLTWEGAQEIIVLTPGGTPVDAADQILPFEQKRDLTWVGKYFIRGKRAEGLVWFDDPWDTMTLNLDSAAVAKLGLTPGRYLRTTVSEAGLTLVTVYGNSWEEARKLPPPSTGAGAEYGYGALVKMSSWNGAEALFCRRDTTEKAVQEKHQTSWITAQFEVLEVAARTKPVPEAKQDDLRTKNYWASPTFINTALCDIIPDAPAIFPLPDALDQLDTMFAAVGAKRLVDFSWNFEYRHKTFERCCRLYVGQPKAVGVIFASDGRFELFFVSKKTAGGWLLTGKSDDLAMELRVNGDGSIETASVDAPVATMWAAHEKRIAATEVAAVPEETAGRLKYFEGFLSAVNG